MNYEAKQSFDGDIAAALDFAAKNMLRMHFAIQLRTDSKVVASRPSIVWGRLRSSPVFIAYIEAHVSEGMLVVRAQLVGKIPALVVIPIVALFAYDLFVVMTQGGGMYLPPNRNTFWWRAIPGALMVLSLCILRWIYSASMRDAKDTIDQLAGTAAAVGKIKGGKLKGAGIFD